MIIIRALFFPQLFSFLRKLRIEIIWLQKQKEQSREAGVLQHKNIKFELIFLQYIIFHIFFQIVHNCRMTRL